MILCDALYDVADRVHERAAWTRRSGCVQPSGHLALPLISNVTSLSDVSPPALKLRASNT